MFFKMVKEIEDTGVVCEQGNGRREEPIGGAMCYECFPCGLGGD